MKTKIIDINQKHFKASFRYNKSNPKDFGLKEVSGKDHYVDKNGDLWKNEILWDSGWGNEYGFVRLPVPNFEQLWILLTESNIENNLLGSAELLTHYPNELKEKLQTLFNRNERLNRKLTKRLSHLELLNNVTNHSAVRGKRPEQVDAEYQEWKKLKDDFVRLKTENLWKRIKNYCQQRL
ncbi:hypothetical protein [Winogradskyella tangerina]|uniref:hypothetical protein n=1 Tax=Winogradskyella tangerina TaxID=2023240 RepID=UPI000DBE8FD0|nr:hypothetical protein [Winogradskyella tangerina]